ncbi:hypothetical protein NP493_16g10019 [Ridgeia piscesae]|uniref:BRO1 domain-containing protein n=1 Tax=Ridgeia piscesae TaxID=27915 RepID=A0AAD9UL19_RIDPI|nr:hypothetical protein NP493_16g10019 [Ridgeia piscesae]
MAHWFHRNPLKATATVSFDFKGITADGKTHGICRKLKETRGQLLLLLSDPNNSTEAVKQATDNYGALLHGVIVSPDQQNPGESKLRYGLQFRWTNTLGGNKALDRHDAVFEQVSMLMNVALWYTKHAAKLAGDEEPSMEQAKEVHKCLRTAAGIYSYIKDSLLSSLTEEAPKGSDIDSRVLTAYLHQCTGEAQEVTIARAIELKHSTSIISSLAYETARMFQAADDSLASLEDNASLKWRKYLQFKINIYTAYAYNYHGETLLAQDKCGDAIGCLQESQKYYAKAAEAGKEYASVRGPGTTARPHEHLFFRKLGPIIKRTLEKCVRENGFIYHQKVPPVVPELELKATYGLAAPEEFTPPQCSPEWTVEAYTAFNITTKPLTAEESKKEKKEEKDLPPVKEEDVSGSKKDPSNSSGCVVS